MPSKIYLDILLGNHSRLDGHIKYGFGDKWPLSATATEILKNPKEFGTVDCSGYVRWSINWASLKTLEPYDGSVNQRQWCKEQGYRELKSYGDLKYAAEDPGRLFIGFFNPVPGIAGHVWLIHKGRTLESNGSHGVNRRDWDFYNALKYRVRGLTAFELPLQAKSGK